MNKRLSQAFSILRSHKHFKLQKKNIILLLLPMGLGDAVMFLDTIDYYFETFSNSKKIAIMTTNTANQVFHYARPNLQYEFFEYNPMKMDTDTQYFMTYLNRFGGIKFDTVIYPLRGFLTMDLLFGKLHADRKITLDTVKENVKKNIKIRFRDRLIKKSIVLQFHPSDMDLIRYARIAEMACCREIKARLPEIKIDKRTTLKPYCLISIGTSRFEKCWPASRYGEIANYILTNTNNDVIFTGSNEDRKTVEQLTEFLEPKNRITNQCGKTTLEELFELISGAKVIIGGDSGPIHVAVALNVLAVCIVGGWDYERIYPYKVEVIEDGRNMPIVVNTGYKDCYRCSLFYGKRGATNQTCTDMISKGKPCLCIDDISADLVIEKLKHIL